MQPLWTSQEIARSTGGSTSSHWEVSNVSIDTRTLQCGDLFIPLPGKVDGHLYISKAIEKGASGVVTQEPTHIANSVQVESTILSLDMLAHYARNRCNALRIGVTGSMGKTTVKEILFSIFSRYKPSHKSVKSYNNHYGVPLTLARMPKETEFGIFEMGMNHAGELDKLSELVQPHIAVITNIGPSHIGNFKSLEAIARAKAEIVNGMHMGSTVVLEKHGKFFDLLSDVAFSSGLQVRTFGITGDEDVTCNVTFEKSKIVTISYPGGTLHAKVNNLTQADLKNYACAAAVATFCSVPKEYIINGFKNTSRPKGRGQVVSTTFQSKPITIIDQSYNANPESMALAIEELEKYSGRKIVVMGDMHELGSQSPNYHTQILQYADNANIDIILTAGQSFGQVASRIISSKVNCFQDWISVRGVLSSLIQPNDTILIKGSNASGVYHLVDFLKQN